MLVMEMNEITSHHRKINRGTKDIERINNRLNRIDGQIKGIKKMIKEDVYCNEILIQLASVEKAIRNVTNIILEDHLYNCITDDLENGKLETIDEIISLFKRFNK